MRNQEYQYAVEDARRHRAQEGAPDDPNPNPSPSLTLALTLALPEPEP